MIAVLDANILFPQYLCDLMLSLAEANLFQPRWSPLIHEEWTRNLLKHFPQLERARIVRRQSMMDRAFPEASVAIDSKLIESITGVHPKDRHVVAAALAGQASFIVTFNGKDFRRLALPISVIDPDVFASSLFENHPDRVIETLNRMRATYSRPVVSVADLLSIFRANRLNRFANHLTTMSDRL